MENMKIKLFVYFVMLSFCFNYSAALQASINPTPNSQLVGLNLQIKSKKNTMNSDIMMPFYQTAELEKMIGNKNIFIELNPKRGKYSDEISIELKFSHASGSKAFFKKEIIAKVNQVSKLSYRGMSIQIRPVLN